MRKTVFKTIGRALFLLSLSLVLPAVVNAQTSSSPSYSTYEYSFGTGGDNGLSSSSYSANAATGATGVGSASSTNYSAEAGSITPRDEYIEFVVSGSTVALGQQSVASTSQGTATFYVKAYVSSGYVVRNASPAPTYNGHTLASPGSATASAVGTEQFGINLAANTCALCVPSTSFGAVPVQTVDGTFSYGVAASGYNTANQYKYTNGDIIAQSTKSSGRTDFTISYILNIASNTPAGFYTMNHIMVATAGY